MIQTSPTLFTLLQTSSEFIMADLITIITNTGNTLRYTSTSFDLILPGFNLLPGNIGYQTVTSSFAGITLGTNSFDQYTFYMSNSAPGVYQDIFNQGDSTYAIMDACCYIVPSDGSYNTTWTNASDDWASAAIEFNITLNQIMIYDGANWIPCTINYWNGSAWTVQELEIYEAGDFLPVYQSAV